MFAGYPLGGLVTLKMSRSVIARLWFPRMGAGPEAGAGLAIDGRRGAAAVVVVVFTTAAHAVNVTIHHDAAFAHSALL